MRGKKGKRSKSDDENARVFCHNSTYILTFPDPRPSACRQDSGIFDPILDAVQPCSNDILFEAIAVTRWTPASVPLIRSHGKGKELCRLDGNRAEYQNGLFGGRPLLYHAVMFTWQSLDSLLLPIIQVLRCQSLPSRQCSCPPLTCETHVILLLHVDSPSCLADSKRVLLAHPLDPTVVFLIAHRRGRRQEEGPSDHGGNERESEEREWMFGKEPTVFGGYAVCICS